MIELGIDRLINDKKLRSPLRGKRVGLLGHPASVTSRLAHSLDALKTCRDLNVTAAFGPQHGMRGDKQDNMIESGDYIDPAHKIPIYSLYGKTRRPTPEMLDTFDVLLVDLQDVGCRIYTFITTLLYVMQACAEAQKAVWILDRPNPVGRPVEGFLLEPGWESFVGAAPMPMRHGMTVGEMAIWFKSHFKLAIELKVISMHSYKSDRAPGFGWPVSELAWVNPSPNAQGVTMARAYAGTVILEGTNLSEGRGTTRPLEIIGAPGLPVEAVISKMKSIATAWLKGCCLRPCFFEPTFHKHQGKLCSGIQIHTEGSLYRHEKFKPYRLAILFLKALHLAHPDMPLFRDFAYEYETTRLPFDVINGGMRVRQWIEDPAASASDLDRAMKSDESAWKKVQREYSLY